MDSRSPTKQVPGLNTVAEPEPQLTNCVSICRQTTADGSNHVNYEAYYQLINRNGGQLMAFHRVTVDRQVSKRWSQHLPVFSLVFFC
jgi:hypothetical protein